MQICWLVMKQYHYFDNTSYNKGDNLHIRKNKNVERQTAQTIV